MRIIGLFSPALISIAIRHSRNSKLTWQMPKVLIEYGICVLVNVWVTTVIITYVLNVSGVVVDALSSFPFFTKYTVIAVVAAVFVPYIQEMVNKYFQITFLVRTKNEVLEEYKKNN